ncbi:hypothetical protein V1460_25445 [Streptomyces sp. SCSIO 30461]|uniref:hypothetical protein n=1 Tax=Streptomyces sp. SCSIO 30461 TaxID=3118085 RepID=UPI0030D1A42C
MSDLDVRLDAEMPTAFAECADGRQSGVLPTSFCLPLAAAVLVCAGGIGLVAAMLLVVRPRLARAARGSFL